MKRHSTEALSFVWLAVRQLEDACKHSGRPVPDGVREVISDLILAVSGGQRASSVEQAAGPSQIGAMAPLLVDYAAACELLSCSDSTLRRRIRSGELTPVGQGKAARFRVADLNRYVDELSTDREGAA